MGFRSAGRDTSAVLAGVVVVASVVGSISTVRPDFRLARTSSISFVVACPKTSRNDLKSFASWVL